MVRLSSAWFVCLLSVFPSAVLSNAPACMGDADTEGSAWLQVSNRLSHRRAEATASAVCPTTGDGQNLGTVSSRINECSGLAASRKNNGLYWTHNDSGGKARLFGIDKSGDLKNVVWVDGASARDWEDIAVGPGPTDGESYIYIADIGDNDKRRDSIQIYRVREPTVDGNSGEDSKVTSTQRFEIRYPDGAHDCEAIFVDQGPSAKAQGTSGRVYIITKRYKGDVYWVDLPQVPSHTLTFTKAGFLNHEGKVTAADINPQGSLIAVRTYDQLIMYPRPSGSSVEYALQSDGCHVSHEYEKQGESIAFGSDGSHYLTVSEGNHAPVWYFPVHSADAVGIATCGGVVLNDVEKQCPLDDRSGCKVLADNMQQKTCHQYCAGHGLECVNGWEEVDESCSAKEELGCHMSYVASHGPTSDLLCQCQPSESLDACGCRIGQEGWSRTRGRCHPSSDTDAEEAAWCLAES